MKFTGADVVITIATSTLPAKFFDKMHSRALPAPVFVNMMTKKSLHRQVLREKSSSTNRRLSRTRR
jgi:hypothetical protein